MKIAILACRPDLYSHQRLIAAGLERGHEMQVISPLTCYIGLGAEGPEIFDNKGKSITGLDAVIPRIGASVTFYGTAILRQLETMGVYPLNESIAISRSRDKLRSLQLLSKKGIPLPKTGFAHSAADANILVQMLGGAPVILKLLEGAQGKGVVLLNSHSSAISAIDAFKDLKANILIQEYIEESQGSDIRCFVIGNQVVAAMRRLAKHGEFRANIHQGGQAQQVKLTVEEKQMAIKAAKAMGLNVAGVDLIQSRRGTLVLEINSSPGLEGIESITGLDLAQKIILFIEKHAKHYNLNTKNRG